jgi:hypothetical protein
MEEQILLVRRATAANLHHEPPLALALGHLGVLEGVQAAGALEGGARGDGGGTAAGEREGVARELGAAARPTSAAVHVCAFCSR